MSIHATEPIDIPDLETARWRIDPTRSSVAFHTKGLWGLATVNGRFSRYAGTLDLAGRPAIELIVESGSLDTDHEKRDKHLRSPDFLAAERHPSIRFVSEAAALDGDRLTILGRLHARGADVPLELTATLRRIDDELAIEVAGEVDHRLLGMVWNKLGAVRAPTRLRLDGRLVRDGGPLVV
jgi:polyisoprenoid-binding protein YceI